MIGNDIVDLVKAKQESDIFRPRYLEKVCSPEEMDAILLSSNQIHTFWRIWTMKESAYKAFQRHLNFKTVFNPFSFNCQFNDSDFGSVNYRGQSIFTKTIQAKDFIYSEVINSAVKHRYFGSTFDFLLNLKAELNLQYLPKLLKSTQGLPILKLGDKSLLISKTHHGKFQVFQY